MSKGLEFEHDVRIVSEKIYKKIGSRRSGSLTISDQDFYKGLYEDPLFSFLSYDLKSNQDLGLILLQIEKEQRGKIKIVSQKPKTTFVDHGETRVRIESFEVSFDIEKTPAKQITEFLLSTEGSGCLYQTKGSQLIAYKLTPTKKEILSLLSKGKPIDTKTLEEQTGCDNISREISHIREAINNKFGISGNKVIPPTKAGQGYVIAPSFVIVKRKLQHP